MKDITQLKPGFNQFTAIATLTLIGAFLLMMINGFVYCWGNIEVYIVGYLRDLGNNVDIYEMYIVSSLMVITTTIFMPIAMRIVRTHPV